MAIVYSAAAGIFDVFNEAGSWDAVNYWGKVVRSLLSRIEPYSKKSYEYESHSINYIAKYELIFLAVADKTVNSRIVFAFLERIAAQYDKERGQAFTAYLQEQMTEFSSAQQLDKVALVEAEISSVKEIMMENISNIMARGERIEDLFERTDSIAVEADAFKRHSTSFRKSLRNARYWSYFAIALVVIIILTVIIIIASR